MNNSGFANMHSDWYLQLRRSDLPPGSSSVAGAGQQQKKM